jgi:hypothetical protein
MDCPGSGLTAVTDGSFEQNSETMGVWVVRGNRQEISLSLVMFSPLETLRADAAALVSLLERFLPDRTLLVFIDYLILFAIFSRRDHWQVEFESDPEDF